MKAFFEKAAPLVMVFLIASFGLALASFLKDRNTAAQVQVLANLRQERDQAMHRAEHVADSIATESAKRDSAWLDYVASLRDSSNQSIQRIVRSQAARSVVDVLRHGGNVAQAPDTGSGRPRCEVSLTCTEAIALVASDSLLRGLLDSAAGSSRIAAATCTAAVAQARVDRDSILVASVPRPSPRGWTTGLVAAALVVGILLGVGAAR